MGDIGEIWFGEDCQERLLDWIEDCDEIVQDDSIIDLGCGNAAMLIELRKRGFTNLTGVDYSQKAVDLANSIIQTEELDNIKLEVADLITEDATQKYSCLTRPYKVCVDKGTYDAISLMPAGDKEARHSYLQTVKSIMTPNSLLVLTSCNWTKEQLMAFFSSDFKLYEQIPTPTFQFGGQTGNSVTSLILKLKS